MDKDKVPPSMVSGCHSRRIEQKGGGPSQPIRPIIPGPQMVQRLPLELNREHLREQMDEHQWHMGGPVPFSRGPPFINFLQGPPPIGFNMAPPPLRMGCPSAGAPTQEYNHNYPPVCEDIESVYHPASTSDGKGSIYHPLAPHVYHNQPKRTFHTGEFSVSDFTHPSPATSVPLYIPQVFGNYANASTADENNQSMQQVNRQSAVHQFEEETDEHLLNADEKWIKGFEQRILKRQVEPTKKSLSLKLSDAQDLLGNFQFLRQRLKNLKDEMKLKHIKAEENLWKNYMQETRKIKENLLTILSEIEDEKFIASVKSLTSQRQSKRSRTKKQKEQLRCKKESLKKKQLTEKREIDIWREKLEEEEKGKRREKAVKLEADSILGEVRQKQTEALRMQQLLESLVTLRQARLNKGVLHGYQSSPKESLHFSSTVKAISEVIDSQVKEYHLEEQTLRVMMGENVDQSPESNELSSTVSRQEAALSKLIFGDATPVNPKISKEYTAAEDSWEVLLQRRFQWDQYITDEATPLASTIPINWVLPTTNASKDWAQYRTLEKC